MRTSIVAEVEIDVKDLDMDEVLTALAECNGDEDVLSSALSVCQPAPDDFVRFMVESDSCPSPNEIVTHMLMEGLLDAGDLMDELLEEAELDDIVSSLVKAYSLPQFLTIARQVVKGMKAV